MTAHDGARGDARKRRDTPAVPTTEEREAWRALAEGATEGPWTTLGERADGSAYVDRPDDQLPWIARTPAAADAAFITAARTAVPMLLDALDKAEAELADAKSRLACHGGAP